MHEKNKQCIKLHEQQFFSKKKAERSLLAWLMDESVTEHLASTVSLDSMFEWRERKRMTTQIERNEVLLLLWWWHCDGYVGFMLDYPIRNDNFQLV